MRGQTNLNNSNIISHIVQWVNQSLERVALPVVILSFTFYWIIIFIIVENPFIGVDLWFHYREFEIRII
jgi:hypothetical protein